MSKMFLMCGLSGAGKTTFAKKFAEEKRYRYISIDDFYKENNYYGDVSPWDDPEISFQIWIKFFKAIHLYELHDHYTEAIVIDTNAPTFVKRQQFIDWFPCFDEYNLIYIAVDEDLRYKNNLARGRVVPSDEMARMHDEFEEPVAMLDTEANVYLCPEKRWNNIMVYINKNNNFVACENSY